MLEISASNCNAKKPVLKSKQQNQKQLQKNGEKCLIKEMEKM